MSPVVALADQELTTGEREALHEAILKSFAVAELEMLLDLKWGVRLSDHVYLGNPGNMVVYNLITWAEALGRGRELISLLYAERPRRDDLRALAGASVEPSLAASKEVADRPTLPRQTGMVDFGQFTRTIGMAASSVCRIDTREHFHSGFLVGRRHVLTNFHVVKAAVEAGVDGGEVRCRFDYDLDDEAAAAEDVVIKGAPGTDWIGPHSPPSQSDYNGTGVPQPGELDFALLRLAAPVEPGRKHFLLSVEPPVVTAFDPIIIAQHAWGQPLKVSVGVVVELPAAGMRYRYNAMTAPGASGSPVFALDGGLVGIHHASYRRIGGYGQAVPVWRIARFLVEAGVKLDEL